MPGGAKLLVEGVLDEDGGVLVVAAGVELIESHGAHLDGLVAHFGRHVRVLFVIDLAVRRDEQ